MFSVLKVKQNLNFKSYLQIIKIPWLWTSFFDNLGIRAKNSVLAHPNVDSWAFYLILLSAMLCRNIPHSDLLFGSLWPRNFFFEFFKMNNTLVKDPHQYFGFGQILKLKNQGRFQKVPYFQLPIKMAYFNFSS